MTTDNVQMWKDLYIDLDSHDMLLNALGPIYQDVYLSQENRPQGMGFFDFVVGADMVTHNKPHPEMVEQILEALNISAAKTTLVGDSIVDMQMGKAAGVGLAVSVTESGIATKEDLTSHSDVVLDSVRSIRIL